MKENCFAFDSTKRRCKALKSLYCKNQKNCAFFRTKEENRLAKIEAEKRAECKSYCTSNKIKVIYKEPLKDPEVIIIENSPTAISEVIGGLTTTMPIEDTNYILFFNDDPKVKTKFPNVELDDNIVYGKFLVGRDDPENETIQSLTYTDINVLKRYLKKSRCEK